MGTGICQPNVARSPPAYKMLCPTGREGNHGMKDGVGLRGYSQPRARKSRYGPTAEHSIINSASG